MDAQELLLELLESLATEPPARAEIMRRIAALRTHLFNGGDVPTVKIILYGAAEDNTPHLLFIPPRKAESSTTQEKPYLEWVSLKGKP